MGWIVALRPYEEPSEDTIESWDLESSNLSKTTTNTRSSSCCARPVADISDHLFPLISVINLYTVIDSGRQSPVRTWRDNRKNIIQEEKNHAPFERRTLDLCIDRSKELADRQVDRSLFVTRWRVPMQKFLVRFPISAGFFFRPRPLCFISSLFLPGLAQQLFASCLYFCRHLVHSRDSINTQCLITKEASLTNSFST